MDKKQIRKVMKVQRAELTKDQVLAYSSSIWNEIYKIPSFQSASTILLYSSFGNEVNTVEIATKALDLGKTIAYPVTNSTTNTMAFHKVNHLDELALISIGSFSLLEPRLDPSTKVAPDSHTLMIVPGLAFDQEGYRTGYGGGFYDKYIAKYPALTTIGVCYDFQVVDRIPIDEYDQPVGLLVMVGVAGA